ncbi:hypothetical protein AXG93_2015s1300 [Marchantia polymorpha subsp. ruderalis]|uniref:Profilin n=1 Tax=Marchantia polymorpha subsp. ruderalis TaxID=1480154 RepID=A0A176W451_MARPO|nr:hypothetical protein AXG93_2015s1300 [Marchantia polymorpha subsp. ruderalis]
MLPEPGQRQSDRTARVTGGINGTEGDLSQGNGRERKGNGVGPDWDGVPQDGMGWDGLGRERNHDREDGNVWAQSANFPELQGDEIDKVVKGFVDAAQISMHGLYLGGLKYMVIQGEPGQVLRGKKGTGGVCIKKTNSALVIGLYEDPTKPGECNIVVERLGDYLYEQGI